MVKVRLIPVMLMRQGILVKSIQFKTYRPVGNPLNAIEFFNQWNVDEIVFLDITPGKISGVGRLDDNFNRFESLADYTKYISTKCFVPLSVGGGIKTVEDMKTLFNAGADKVIVNTIVNHQPEILKQAAESFGRQALVVSMDVKQHDDGRYEVITGYGKELTGIDPIVWAKRAEALGAGEILLNSIDRDGMMNGYDVKLVRMVADAVSIPVIALGGVGKWQHLVEGVTGGHVAAVAAANIWHFSEMSTVHAKKYMSQQDINVRL